MKRGYSLSLLDCSRRRKLCVGSVDGICDFPDSILAHILSFLPTKNAVATHILSKRWKFLWTMTDNLDFTCPCHKMDLYVKFVNRVLLFHKPGFMNRFSLTTFRGCTPYDENMWISVAVLRNVHELYASVPNSKLTIQVQTSIFSCESLKALELDCKTCIFTQLVVSLPRLESLKLMSISFRSEETLCKLLGGCPVLKSLYIEIDILKTMKYCQLDIRNGFEFKCIISSDSLRRLEVCACGLRGAAAPTLGVKLDAPFLEYIKLDQISSICIHQSLVFLVEAVIALVSLKPVFKSQNYYDSVAKAFHSFNCVKTLTLSPQVIKAHSRATIKMKTGFNNLTRLEVRRVRNWTSLHEFIMLADCLEVLTINTDEGQANHFGKDHFGSKSDQVPRCFSNSLRTVSFDDFDGFEDEIAMVGYILKHGSVLEAINLRFQGFDVDARYKAVKEISKLTRKSPTCKVEFHDN